MAQPKRSWRSWWQLYTLVLLMVGLLILAHYLAPSPGWRAFLDGGVIVAGYGLITAWLETHSSVLLREPPANRSIQIFKSREGLESPPIEFHLGSASPIIYDIPEFPTDNLGSNGHPAQTLPSFPEDLSKN